MFNFSSKIHFLFSPPQQKNYKNFKNIQQTVQQQSILLHTTTQQQNYLLDNMPRLYTTTTTNKNYNKQTTTKQHKKQNLSFVYLFIPFQEFPFFGRGVDYVKLYTIHDPVCNNMYKPTSYSINTIFFLLMT